ncbi:MAG: hypothetical protein VX528_14325, partial [Candidatus Latescibacterota bacterium]|nr:hypothetical protein [Candidatus Latescibacterota bacterium]
RVFAVWVCVWVIVWLGWRIWVIVYGWRRGCFVFVGLGGIWGRRECCVWWRDGDVKLWRVCECGV